ncbi:MAG: AbrB/MazE/SpoVT family DNA-binding domain-containing protein [Chloroflexi bacterium]|nr:AbrB/MazE/SpoVT family DNA-binding domain-containing protein [Chloroflexota bacterium]
MATRVQIGKGGRLVVPVKLRKALNIKAGDEIVARLENDSIRLIPVQQAVNLAQKVVRQYVPQGVSLVDELIKARREEARGK